MTKSSTIWQIIDYLSKQIDYRLIVNIIDSGGRPASAFDKSELDYIYLDCEKREASALVSEGKIDSFLVHLHRSGFRVDDHL